MERDVAVATLPTAAVLVCACDEVIPQTVAIAAQATVRMNWEAAEVPLQAGRVAVSVVMWVSREGVVGMGGNVPNSPMDNHGG